MYLTMTHEEILNQYKTLKEVFGDKLPNPVHYPNQFVYYWMLYVHDQKLKGNMMVKYE